MLHKKFLMVSHLLRCRRNYTIRKWLPAVQILVHVSVILVARSAVLAVKKIMKKRPIVKIVRKTRLS